jgi:hypothetical protein
MSRTAASAVRHEEGLPCCGAQYLQPEPRAITIEIPHPTQAKEEEEDKGMMQ